VKLFNIQDLRPFLQVSGKVDDGYLIYRVFGAYIPLLFTFARRKFVVISFCGCSPLKSNKNKENII
jgi:hypothetical protein